VLGAEGNEYNQLLLVATDEEIYQLLPCLYGQPAYLSPPTDEPSHLRTHFALYASHPMCFSMAISEHVTTTMAKSASRFQRKKRHCFNHKLNTTSAHKFYN
jgi:hypothetical protein